MIYGGGPVIDRARIVLIFRGPGWKDGPLDVVSARSAFTSLLATPYFSELQQYQGIRRPVLVETLSDASAIGHLGPDPRGFLKTNVRLIDTSEIIQTVKNARKAGMQEPIGDQAVYLVAIYADPLPVFSDARYNNAFGFHDTFTDDVGKTVRYGVGVFWTGSPIQSIWNSSGGFLAAMTHELIEACTDPEGGTGFRLDNGEEVCDLNDVRPVELPGLTLTVGVAAYWSDLRSEAVVPTTYSVKITFGHHLTDPVPSVRSLLSGGTSVATAMRARLEP